ncbi:MAG: DUF1553 domain-containing protein [Acidobacteria bacterium]|nr:DUF1553 domain-containing protein [Acidobacteriota bacterium]
MLSRSATVALIALALSGQNFDLAKRRDTHWAWQPLRPHANRTVDQLLNERLSKESLTPAPRANANTLHRRLAFDLTGLPPDPNAPNDYAAQVDFYLAKPQFGERWARHWMDLVRYSESHGSEGDPDVPEAWRYRDYLIRALNGDVPYNQLVREHIAGDLLAKPRIDSATRTNESIIGTAFYRFVEHGFQPVDPWEDRVKWVDNQVDVLSKAFQGLTVSCARCHDHKFDAISQRDYYALFGILANARPTQRNIDIQPDSSKLRTLKTKIKQEWIDQLKSANWAGAKLPAQISVTPKTESFENWISHGSVVVTKPGEHFDTAIHQQGAYSNTITDKHAAVLASPRFKIDTDYISIKASGGNNAFAQIIVENYAVPRGGIYNLRVSLTNPELAWHTIKTEFWKGFTAYIELATQDDATHFFVAPAKNSPKPDRNGRSWFGVQAVAFHNTKTPPADEVKDTAAFRNAAYVNAAIEAWRNNTLTNEQAVWLSALMQPGQSELRAEYARLEAELPVLRRAPGVVEEAGPPQPLLVRGNIKSPSDPVPHRFLSALNGPAFADAKSARLELANAIVADSNPLTARVFVNRIWSKLFGKGIVATVDNFGLLGDRPSHADLLDTLARELISDGYSIKKTIRKLVLTSAYQRSSQPSAEALSKEPANRLLQHMPVKRLEAEAIRDTILSLSGQLRNEMYGPGVDVYYTHDTGSTKGDRPKGPLDGKGRRSVYLEVRRNATNPFLEVFDFPIPASTRGERDMTNVPAQSLAMLNSPFVIQQCEHWAANIVKLPVDDRIPQVFQAAFYRAPTQAEVTQANLLAEEIAAEHKVSRDDVKVWRDVAQSLLNLKEFIYIQ